MVVDIVNKVAASVPRYNDYLLRGFMHEQIDGAAEFVSTMFKEAVKLFGGIIEYRDYQVVSPERCAEHELKERRGCRITTSDLYLVEYIFVHNGKEYRVPLYIPFLRNDVVMIEDTNYVLQRSIKEQAFSRTMNGVTIKVIRQPIPFYNSPTSFRLESVSDDWFSNERVTTTSIYNQSQNVNRRKMPDVTVIHYLLCKFGLVRTMERFGLSPDDYEFCLDVGGDTETFRYFSARHAKRKLSSDLFFKIRKDKLEDPKMSKLVASILYTITTPVFHKHQLRSFYEPTGSVFRIMLGRIIHGNSISEIQSKSKIDTHISSVDTYMDPITRARLASYGISVGDIYDLFQYVFMEIEKLCRVSHTDLYNTRVDYIEEVLVETVVKNVYLRWYDALRRLGGGAKLEPKKFTEREVTRILRMPDTLIAKLSDSRVVQKNPPAYGDNALVGWLSGKVRQSSLSASGQVIKSPDHRFHSSQVAVESIVAFSKTNPGAAGTINPYLEITRNGNVVRPDFADELDELDKYLP